MGIFKQIANPTPTATGTGGIFKQMALQQQPELSLEDKLRQQGYKGQVGAEQVAGIKKIGSSISKGASDIALGGEQSAQGGFLNKLKGLGNTVKGVAEAGFGTIAGASRVALAPFTPAIEKAAPVVVPAVVSAITKGLITPEMGQEISNTVAPKIEEWARKNPDAATLTGDILETVLLAVGGRGVSATVRGAVSKEGLLLAREGIVSDAKSLFAATKNAVTKSPVDSAAKITEMISPKATVKEVRLAQTQGRLVEGKKPTLFKAGTEDKILPSAKTKSATQTIIKEIPNAQKMSPTELYKAVDSKITETATNLKPKMQATPIQPKTIEKLNTDWESIKRQQMIDAPATEEANVLKRQSRFESFLKKSGANNQDDLWNTRIAYDDSIPANVKKANTMSSESLQLQREEWLQNRQILNDAFETSAKPEFKTMSDLYEARNGLLSQTKVEGALPSKFVQWTKDNPQKWTAAKVILGAQGLKFLGVDILP